MLRSAVSQLAAREDTLVRLDSMLVEVIPHPMAPEVLMCSPCHAVLDEWAKTPVVALAVDLHRRLKPVYNSTLAKPTVVLVLQHEDCRLRWRKRAV